MFGHPFNGTIEKVARVTVNGQEVAQVRVDTATIQYNEDYVTAVTARRGNLAAIPALHNFYEQHNACFPENPGDVHRFVNGLTFDGVPYVYHRHDKPTDNVIFRPLTLAETHTEGVEVTEHNANLPDGGSLGLTEGHGNPEANQNIGSGEKHTAENWPIGGDTPETPVPQGAANAPLPIVDTHPLAPSDIGGEGKPNFPCGNGLSD